jgi:hypothetical protein
VGLKRSKVLGQIHEHIHSGESTLVYRLRKRTFLSEDFRELLHTLKSIDGTHGRKLRTKTARIVASVEEWNPSFPMSGKLSTEIMRLLNELHSLRLEKTGTKIRVRKKKSIYTKANELADKSLRTLVRMLFWPFLG